MPEQQQRLPSLRSILGVGEFLPTPPSMLLPQPHPPATSVFSSASLHIYPTPYALLQDRRTSLCARHASGSHRRTSFAPYPSPVSPAFGSDPPSSPAQQFDPYTPHPFMPPPRPSGASRAPTIGGKSSTFGHPKQSCYGCRRSKKRCQEKRPCERCVKRGWECTMEEEPENGPPAPSDHDAFRSQPVEKAFRYLEEVSGREGDTPRAKRRAIIRQLRAH